MPSKSFEFTNYQAWSKDMGIDTNRHMLYVKFKDDVFYSVEDIVSSRPFKLAEKVFFIDHEAVIYSHYQKLLDYDKVFIWDSTLYDHPRVNTYLFWFDWVKELEQEVNLLENTLSPTDKQPSYKFDVLLGTMRDNKIFLYNKCKQTKDKNLFLLGTIHSPLDGIADDYVSGHNYEDGTWRPPYNDKNQTANVSCFIPYKIYNNSWYSLIAEPTRNDGNFFTEKTAKPLASKRVFINFGDKNYLRDLKELGFKTFDNILDESYDKIENKHKRWEAAWEQVELLNKMDPREVYQNCNDILLYNFNHFFQSNWQEKMFKDIQNILHSSK